MKPLKNRVLLILLGFILFSCTKDNEAEVQENSLLGSWQLTQVYTNPGAGAGDWANVENGYIYTFSGNGNFYSTRFDDCTYGTFSSEANLLTLDYECDGFTAGIEDPEGVLVEEFVFESGLLVLNPTYLHCIEGCGFKFRKISD